MRVCLGGRAQSKSSTRRRGSSAIPTCGSGVWPNGGWSTDCWHCAGRTRPTRQRCRGSCAGADRAVHQGAVRVRSRAPGAIGQQRFRAKPSALGAQPEDQRWHALCAGDREQDGSGFAVRHLARPTSQPPHRLPPASRLPLTLNRYPCAIRDLHTRLGKEIESWGLRIRHQQSLP